MELIKYILGIILLVLCAVVFIALILPISILMFALSFSEPPNEVENKYDYVVMDRVCGNCLFYKPTINGVNDELIDYSEGFCSNLETKRTSCIKESFCFKHVFNKEHQQ